MLARRWRLVALIILAIAGGPLAALAATPVSDAVTFTGAGDIASCYDDNDAATAALAARIGGAVLTLGDTVYDTGSATCH